MTTATDVARHMVGRFISMEMPATSMKVHRPPYLAWMEHQRLYGRRLGEGL